MNGNGGAPGLTLHVQSVTHRYGKATALHPCSVSLRAGRILALVGPNGAGKTTLLSILARQRRLQAGRLVTEGSPRAFSDLRVGWVPESSVLFGGVRFAYFVEHVMGPALGLSRSEAAARGRALARALDFEAHYARKPKIFSHGTRRKASLLLALLERPDLLVLDETVSGLDLHALERMTTLLREEVRTHPMAVIISDHRIDVLQMLAQDVVFLNGGRVVARDAAASFAATYGDLTTAYRALIPGGSGAAPSGALAG